MNSQNPPPSTTNMLPPDVWSRILSHLAPSDISKAASALRLTKDVQEHASRIAVESMIQMAAKYIRKHPEEAQETLEIGLDLEPFVEDCEQMTASKIQESFCTHKGQEFHGIYEDMHRVVEYLSACGFHDRDKMVTIAVHSIYLMASSEEVWGRDD